MVIEYKKILREIEQLLDSGDALMQPQFRDLFSCLYIPRGEDRDWEELVALFKCQKEYNYVELDKIRGCMVGGAVGDALGFEVEFLDSDRIFEIYGKKGIAEYELYDGKALISDDTQMALFTAEGLLRAVDKYSSPTVEQYVRSIYESYLGWFHTQQLQKSLLPYGDSLLLHIKDLYQRRAPGNTCMTALGSGTCGTYQAKINDSKGCGGVMRIAPIALYLAQLKGDDALSDIGDLAGRASAITHGHDLGYIPSAFLAVFIACVAKGDFPHVAVNKAKEAVKKLYPHSPYLDYCLELVDKAQNLAQPEDEQEALSDLEAIKMLGEGWVAEETLAIALYCSLKYLDDENGFKKAIVASVNHDGDSDSTGAVTGNIMGAVLGIKNIPQKFIEGLELKETLLDIADKLQLHQLDTE